MENKWLCFFSQSGKEIMDLSEIIGRVPDRIITNKRPEHLRKIDERIPRDRLFYTANKPSLEEYYRLLLDYSDPLITLHGWLRIIPEEISSVYKVFNGHPGLVNIFGDKLKGFNAQERIVGKKEEYPVIGSIIHRVTPELDSGEILESVRVENTTTTVGQAYNTLRETSLRSWVNFMKHNLKE